MLRKFFSLLLVVFLLFNTCSNVLAFSQLEPSALDYAKENIKKYEKGEYYAKKLYKIDNFVAKINNLSTLERLESKVEKKLSKYEYRSLSYALLNYINLVIKKRIEVLKSDKVEEIIKNSKNLDLPSSELKKVENEIIKLQLSFLDSSKNMVDSITKELKKTLNSTEKGNFKINVEGSGAMFGHAKGELKLKNYEGKTSGFDSELKSQVDLLINSSLVGQEEFNAQFSSFVNYISKDGNVYLLLEKLSYSGVDKENIRKIFDKLKDLGNKGEYIKLENRHNAMFINLVKSFNINSFFSKAKKELSNSMFKVYKKEGNKYYLYPKKDACDAIRYMSYKITKYGNMTCSDDEYHSFLRGLLETGELYIVFDGLNNHLGFDIDTEEVSGEIKIYYTTDKVKKMIMNLNGPRGESIKMEFISGEKLNFVIDIKNENVYISFKSDLKYNNKFEEINFVGNIGEDFTSSFNYSGNKFDGKFKNILKEYDYSDGKMNKTKSGEVSGFINGTIINDKLNSLVFKINGDNNFKKYHYDYETKKSEKISVNSKFVLDYKLENSLINGKISYSENDKNLFKVDSEGQYRKEYFELNNTFYINPGYLFGDDGVNGDLDMKFDGDQNNMKYNINFKINSKQGDLKIDVEGDVNKTFDENVEIKTPTKYKKAEDVLSEKEMNDSEFFN